MACKRNGGEGDSKGGGEGREGGREKSAKGRVVVFRRGRKFFEIGANDEGAIWLAIGRASERG